MVLLNTPVIPPSPTDQGQATSTTRMYGCRSGESRPIAQVPVPDKNLVKLRFEQAATTYEEHAQVQFQVADRLLYLIHALAPACGTKHILEIGCCTGLLTEKIIQHFSPIEHLTVSDLVEAFGELVEKRISQYGKTLDFLAGDIETIPLPHCFDLIISSSTLQWVHDFPRLLDKLAAHLHPNGLLAFSVYGQDNMAEIRTITGLGLPYMNLDQLIAEVEPRFEILAAKEAWETVWFPSPLAVLQHLRATGVNAIGQRTWSRRELSAFLAQYREKFNGPQGVHLTYHPMYIVAQPYRTPKQTD